MSSTYGEHLKLSIFGQSHGAGIGMVLDGIPAGLGVDLAALRAFLARRAPGQNAYSTPRKEADAPEFLSGLEEGTTCGAPIAAVIRNTNTRSGDYANLKDCPRPGHADYTAQIKYHGHQDAAGGGHFSGRLTAPLCIAGGLCKQWLERKGIVISAHIAMIADIWDTPYDPVSPATDRVLSPFPTLDAGKGEQMQARIAQAKENLDSVGGIVECAVTGLSAGWESPCSAVWREGLPRCSMAYRLSRAWNSERVLGLPLCGAAKATTPSGWKTEKSSPRPTTVAEFWGESPMECP